MNENDGSTARDLDPDTAPDLSRDGRPEKFAKAPVRRTPMTGLTATLRPRPAKR